MAAAHIARGVRGRKCHVIALGPTQRRQREWRGFLTGRRIEFGGRDCQRMRSPILSVQRPHRQALLPRALRGARFGQGSVHKGAESHVLLCLGIGVVGKG
jgi:hypothetical protein